MRRRFVCAFIIIVLGLPGSAGAAQFLWAHARPFSGSYQSSVAVAVDAQGRPSHVGMVTAGTLHVVTHYDIDGSTLWSRDIVGNVIVTGALYDRSNRLVVYGSFIASMEAGGIRLTSSPSASRAFVLRLTSTGSVDWLVAPGDPDGSGLGVQAMATAPDGSLWYTHTWGGRIHEQPDSPP